METRELPLAASSAPGTRRRRWRRRLVVTAAAVLAFNLVIPPYVRPVDGAVTSRFFIRRRPESRFPLAIETHRGIDFAAAVGTPVRAAKSGRVVFSGYSDTLGNHVIIRHWLGFSTLYAHLQRARVRTGALVVKWWRIGSVGASGRATGSHLHFEVWWRQRRLPPGAFLALDSLRRTLLRGLNG